MYPRAKAPIGQPLLLNGGFGFLGGLYPSVNMRLSKGFFVPVAPIGQPAEPIVRAGNHAATPFGGYSHGDQPFVVRGSLG